MSRLDVAVQSLLALLVCVFLGYLLPAGDVYRAAAVALASSLIAVSAMKVVHPKYWWACPVVWFTLPFAIFFALRPLNDLATGAPEVELGIEIPNYADAIWVGIIGYWSFLAGYVITPNRRKHDEASRGISVSTGRLRLAIVASFALFGAFLGSSGGLSTLRGFFHGRSAVTANAYASSSGYLYSAPLFCFPIAVYLLLEARSRKRKARYAWLLLAFSQILTIGVGDRSYFLPALISLILAFSLARGRGPRLATVAILIPALFIVGVTLPRLYRRSGDTDLQAALAQSTTSQARAGFLDGADTAMARDLAIQLRAMPEIGLAGGSTYAGALLRPVPKQVFLGHGKPRSSDEILNQQILGSQHLGAGFSFSIFSEPYLNFGYAGVVFVMALFGSLLRRAFNSYLRHARHPAAIAAYASGITLLIVLVRGGIGVDYQRVAFVTLPLLFAVRTKPRASQRREMREKGSYAFRKLSRMSSRPALPAARTTTAPVPTAPIVATPHV